MLRSPLLLLAALPLAGLPTTLTECSGEVTPTPGPVTEVSVFSGIHQQFGDGDTRTVKTTVNFPEEAQSFQKITLTYTLSCPTGGCDPWDRLAYVQVVENAGTSTEKVVEIGRFITPYGVGGTWTQDVTDLRPVLTGTREVRSFIDTWVNPGWLVDVSLSFEGGTPARKALEVRPLYFGYYGYGDPNNPPDNYLLEKSEQIPQNATGAAVRVLATGHGFGATENCAEFCQKEHTLVAGAVTDVKIPWRDDCRTAGVDGQSGTYWYSRAGWCPGDDVDPRVWDLTGLVQPGQVVPFDYKLQDYVNLETTVSPYWVISAYLILFE